MFRYWTQPEQWNFLSNKVSATSQLRLENGVCFVAMTRPGETRKDQVLSLKTILIWCDDLTWPDP